MMKRHRILRNASLTIAFMCVSLLLSPARATDDEGDSVGASSVNKTDGGNQVHPNAEKRSGDLDHRHGDRRTTMRLLVGGDRSWPGP